MDWLREKTMNWLKSAEPQKAIEEKPKLLTGWRLPFDDGISAIAAILRDVQNGFYIDVGAGDPVVGSVTQLFYEQGWHGINIEPIRLHHESLQKKRIRDINLCMAIGSASNYSTFYEVSDGKALSTTIEERANQYLKKGNIVQSYSVPCCTLDQICADYGVKTVHFLKIDVEGGERSVLEGFSFKVRPWLVIVESFDGVSCTDTSLDWETLITSKEYELVYFDGLNRFYLAKEHLNLRRRLFVPPNME